MRVGSSCCLIRTKKEIKKEGVAQHDDIIMSSFVNQSRLESDDYGRPTDSSGLLKPTSHNRLDLRNLLGRPVPKGGSVSAPSTPVDDGQGGGTASFYLATPSGNSKQDKVNNKKRASSSGPGMAEGVLKDLAHPALADTLKAHSALTIKLLKTGEKT